MNSSAATIVADSTVQVPNWSLRPALVLLAVAISLVVSPPISRGVSPAPDGGYPNQNTAEGDFALNSLDTNSGENNTAIGAGALFGNVAGSGNTAVGDSAISHNTNDYSTAVGYAALKFNTTGTQNTATGAFSLYGTAFGSSNTGNYNTATGYSALTSNTTGDSNTATGQNSLLSNTVGNNNTGNGVATLHNNDANDNTATGYEALYSNTSGTQNTATGTLALAGSEVSGGTTPTTGSFNTATGYSALNSDTNGESNTATGTNALIANTTGSNNTATGVDALFTNTTGQLNTASGAGALFSNNGGNQNTATGLQALHNNTTGSNNTAEGYNALYHNTGSNNVALGASAGVNLTIGGNNIDISNVGKAGEGNTIRVGTQGTQAATYIAGIYSKGVASATGVNVKIDSTGKLGTVLSSARYKEAIKPMDKSSESILQLKPITFRYKKEFDPDGVTQFGLVAEEVEKVCPQLVVKDEEGKPLTVRYDAVNAMLLNEFLKAHRQIEDQQKRIDALEAELSEQRTFIQEWGDKLEMTSHTPQTTVQ